MKLKGYKGAVIATLVSLSSLAIADADPFERPEVYSEPTSTVTTQHGPSNQGSDSQTRSDTRNQGADSGSHTQSGSDRSHTPKFDSEKIFERAQELADIEHQNEVMRLNLRRNQLLKEELTLNNELEEIRSKRETQDMDDRIEEMRAEQDARHRETVSRLQREISALRHQRESSASLSSPLSERFFVTQVFGIGHNIKAKIYFDKNIVTRTVGESVAPGYILDAIDSNGVFINHDGEQHYIPITTPTHANFSTFERSQGRTSNNEQLDMRGLLHN